MLNVKTAPPIARMRTAEYQADVQKCVHCGLCLQACPTYSVFGTEMDSPRGRIVLMRAVSEGRIGADELNDGFTTHISRCLACRACETACPSGVPYGSLVEEARVLVEHARRPGPAERFVRWLGLRQLMPHVGRLKLLAVLLWLYQAVGLHRLVKSMPFLPPTLRVMQAILPPITPRWRDYQQPARPIGVYYGRVAFFIGCIQEALLAPINEATIRVLQRNGYAVVFPQPQTCCGAAQLHVGDEDLARDLARQNIDAFDALNVEAIIVNAGGCGAQLKEYAHLLRDDPAYAEKARQFVAKVQDISQFLVGHLNVPPRGEVRVRATYADSCHLRHAQKIVKPPRDLLKQIPGLTLVELKNPDRCCGSAGVYNLVHPDIADDVLDEKMADIASTGAELIVTTNTGCHMQLYAGVERARLKARVMSLVEVLDLSYRNER